MNATTVKLDRDDYEYLRDLAYEERTKITRLLHEAVDFLRQNRQREPECVLPSHQRGRKSRA